jgi:hypothetical protein
MATGLVIPAEKRGFWRRRAESSVDPDRGSPETTCNFDTTSVLLCFRTFPRSTLNVPRNSLGYAHRTFRDVLPRLAREPFVTTYP